MSDLITWDGKLLTPVTSDYAFRVRCDVQLYYSAFGQSGIGIRLESPPEYFRVQQGGCKYNDPTTLFWTNYQYYVEVDPQKPEYVCES